MVIIECDGLANFANEQTKNIIIMKPKVICHIMASVDGHIQVEHWSAPYKDNVSGELFKVYADAGQSLSTDAWTFGKNTVREYFHDKTDIFGYTQKNVELDTPVNQTTFFTGKRLSKRLFVSFDPDANIVYTASTLRGDDILAVLPMQAATPRYLNMLGKMNISYLVVKDFWQTEQVLEQVNKLFGVKSISLQGGGVLNGGMLNSGVIDELSVVVYPGFDFLKNTVSIFEGVTPTAKKKFRLQFISVQPRLHGAVWLRYKVLYV